MTTRTIQLSDGVIEFEGTFKSTDISVVTEFPIRAFSESKEEEQKPPTIKLNLTLELLPGDNIDFDLNGPVPFMKVKSRGA
jgi:hypothetical protein